MVPPSAEGVPATETIIPTLRVDESTGTELSPFRMTVEELTDTSSGPRGVDMVSEFTPTDAMRPHTRGVTMSI